MGRKEFSNQVVEQLLIQCRRHCCVCGKFCGTKIEIHHIEGHGENSESNAIAVCFDCHAEIKHYNDAHPRGRKYRPSELRKLKQATIRKHGVEADILPRLNNMTDYGQGFYDGAIIAEKRFVAQLIWTFISRYGDFATEILIEFEEDDHATIMEDKYYDDTVDTGHYFSQPEGYQQAWNGGTDLGLWNVDLDREVLFLTKRGKVFRDIVRNSPELYERYEELKRYWATPQRERPKKKPGVRRAEIKVFPGYLGLLQMEQYKPTKIKGKYEFFVIESVFKDDVMLQSMESTKKVSFSPNMLVSIDVDEETGILVLNLPESALREI